MADPPNKKHYIILFHDINNKKNDPKANLSTLLRWQTI